MEESTCCREPEYVDESPCYQEPKEEACCHEEPRKWNALDPTDHHPLDGTVVQEEDAEVKSSQKSIESIIIKDSCDVDVTTTDTQAALNVQAALQVAIALVISISILDSSKADAVTQDLLAKVKSSQTNKQQVYIENSRDVTVSTVDTDIAVNVQILLQILIVLIARLDIL
ncbi:spore coat protein [Radiobacillus kanasensis]|uniref:spore coat protein n=1 Tax=Radiobacillus kanasensis TaxID=2844358 RepID=UPI0038B52541